MSSVLSVVETKLAALPLPVELIMPDGQKVGSADAQIRLTIKDRATLAHLATGQVGVLGEDYVEGKFDISGSMRDLMRLAVAILPGSPIEAARVGRLTELIRRLVSVWRHSIDRDARQIQFHYDLSDDFYALWLDPRRVYSCAYFKTPDMSVAQAQEAKLDHICRKLRLQQGERFLDVGAGWGGLLLWAAEHYGVDATGITLSKNQHAHVNQLIQEKGLQGRVRMELLDYRKLDEATAGGVDNAELGAGMGEFIEKYIFPGGELTHISQVLKSMTEGGLEDLDVENLRPHYARTLWAWSDALEACLPEARKTLPGDEGERSLRAYRMYLAGCAMGFEHGWIALHQVLAQPRSNGRSDELDHPADQAYPWRRDYIYS